MKLLIKREIILVLICAFIFSMNQETKAQPKKAKTKKAAAVTETKQTVPEISYTVSMSKPWTHLLEVEMRLKSWRNAGKNGNSDAGLDAGQLSGARIRASRAGFCRA